MGAAWVYFVFGQFFIEWLKPLMRFPRVTSDGGYVSFTSYNAPLHPLGYDITTSTAGSKLHSFKTMLERQGRSLNSWTVLCFFLMWPEHFVLKRLMRCEIKWNMLLNHLQQGHFQLILICHPCVTSPETSLPAPPLSLVCRVYDCLDLYIDFDTRWGLFSDHCIVSVFHYDPLSLSISCL